MKDFDKRKNSIKIHFKFKDDFGKEVFSKVGELKNDFWVCRIEAEASEAERVKAFEAFIE